METGIADIARFARGVDASPQRVVRVSGPPTFLSQFLAPRLLPLQGQQPGLRIELVGEARQISLSQGETDLALRMVRPLEKGLVARRLAVSWRTDSTGPAIILPDAKKAQDFLGYDDSLDHLPQQRWLKMLAADRSLALRSNDLANLLTAARAVAAADARVVARVPSRRRSYAGRSSSDRLHYRDHERCESRIPRRTGCRQPELILSVLKYQSLLRRNT
jgi:DNA-binding transcriptional LysR family regulator